ncbi:MAG: SLOG family protein [Planctomycetota bacterium]|jgi:hypothetical protein
MSGIRLIIAGSRSLPESSQSVDKIETHLEGLGWHGKIDCVISGTAGGADTCGEFYAERHNIQLVKMPADWKRLGRSAGYRRNEEMADRASHLLAIWDGVTKGTRHMINIARERGLVVAVRKFQKPPPKKKSGKRKKRPVSSGQDDQERGSE